MDSTTWAQMQQNPSLKPILSTDPFAQNPNPTQNYYYSYPPNPNPNVDPQNPQEARYISPLVQPPGHDPYQPVATYTVIHGFTYQQTADGSSAVASSTYCHDPSLVVSNGAVAVDHYGVNHYATGVTMPQNGIEKLVAASSNSKFWTHSTNHPLKTGKWKKVPKKTKVVQSAWCGICSIECNAKDILEKHKMGKKHQKNLEKLKQLSAPGPSAASAPSTASASASGSANPIIGPPENPEKTKSISEQKVRKNPGEPPENLETKRRKVLDGGAAAAAVRTCALCNVVCNSEMVFKYHLVGKKHASMVKKYTSGTGLAAAM